MHTHTHTFVSASAYTLTTSSVPDGLYDENKVIVCFPFSLSLPYLTNDLPLDTLLTSSLMMSCRPSGFTHTLSASVVFMT